MAEDQRAARIDWWEPTEVAFLVVPEFAWELFLGYAAVWGFRKDAPILSAGAR